MPGESPQSLVVRECFGTGLYVQGRGFFVTLELLAICRGLLDAGQGKDATAVLLPTPDGNETALRYRRRSHDFARRVPVHGGEDLLEDTPENLEGDGTRETLAALIDALTIPLPGSRGPLSFKRRMLYPFVGELIHYDAVDRANRSSEGPRRRIALDRYNYRGAGAFAHRVLRTDDDDVRLNEVRAGLAELVSDSGTSLGRLANALAVHDAAKSDEDFADEGEPRARIIGDGQTWAEHLRDGVRNIVSRRTLPRARRVELLMYWVPYCVARYQLDVASGLLGREQEAIPFDQRPHANTIRRASQRLVSRVPGIIGDALVSVAERLATEAGDDDLRRQFEGVARGSASGSTLKDTRAFFTSTMASVGGINAPTGIRHFTVKLPLAEALVNAALPPGATITFDRFCSEILYARYGLVGDERSASAAGLDTTIDRAEFKENSEAFARQLQSLGLLLEYSDATRLIRAEVGA
ncbi:MAG TPA: hypothetical protein VGM80_04705 [Gaiellaceae bacterium]|jgi:hypothetical protein